MSYSRQTTKTKARNKKKIAHPEDDLQATVCEVVKLHGFHGWHTPNGGRRWKNEAARFVGLGVLPGVSDWFIMERWAWYSVDFDYADETFVKFNRGWMWRSRADILEGLNVCLELKIWPNKPTEKQLDFLRESSERGALCAVAYDIDEALQVLRCVCPSSGRRVQ